MKKILLTYICFLILFLSLVFLASKLKTNSKQPSKETSQIRIARLIATGSDQESITEKFAIEPAMAKYALEILDQQQQVNTYLIDNILSDQDKKQLLTSNIEEVIGKCVIVNVSQIKEKKLETKDYLDDLGLITASNLTIAHNNSYVCYSPLVQTDYNDWDNSSDQLFTMVGTVESQQRPAFDIAYDYQIKTPEQPQKLDDMSGKDQADSANNLPLSLVSSNPRVIKNLEKAKRNRLQVAVSGYLQWGYAESQVFFVRDLVVLADYQDQLESSANLQMSAVLHTANWQNFVYSDYQLDFFYPPQYHLQTADNLNYSTIRLSSEQNKATLHIGDLTVFSTSGGLCVTYECQKIRNLLLTIDELTHQVTLLHRKSYYQDPEDYVFQISTPFRLNTDLGNAFITGHCFNEADCYKLLEIASTIKAVN